MLCDGFIAMGSRAKCSSEKEHRDVIKIKTFMIQRIPLFFKQPTNDKRFFSPNNKSEKGFASKIHKKDTHTKEKTNNPF